MKRDLATSLSEEAEQVGARIDKAYGRLANKLRRRADKAKAGMVKSKNRIKRAVLQRRFEIYATAAREIDQSVMDRQAYAGPVLRLKPEAHGTPAQT